MNLNDIIQAITQVGFPCLICLFFLKRLSVQDDRNHEIMITMRNAIDNNTEMIRELVNRFERWFKDDGNLE